jgi:hypothetical protein
VIVTPCDLAIANAFIAGHHRHHKPVVGHRFSLAAWDESRLVGVAICGRPVARAIDHRSVLEVSRLCTDGTKNACSFLYGASARVAKALGFVSIQTYILASEQGASLRASGWAPDSVTRGRDWNTPARMGRRVDQPMEDKIRYIRQLNEPWPELLWPATETPSSQSSLL